MQAMEGVSKRGKMRKKKYKLWENLKLLRPKNLAKEVHVYGYHFSWKAHVLLMIGTLLGIGAVGIVFQLSAVFFTIVLVAAVALLPVLILDMYKKMYEQKRFGDAAAYLEQMLYSFLKTGKVISSLKETIEIFEDGQMRQTLEEAVSYLNQGVSRSEEGVLAESLRLIENRYTCSKIRMVHNLLISAEEYGGDVETSVMLVLEDIELWKRRGYRLLADKKKSHIDNIVSIIVSVMMCAAALYVLDSMKNMFAAESVVVIFKAGIIQLSSMLFLLFLYHVFLKSSKSLTSDWLVEDGMHEEDYIRNSYRTVMDFDEQRERKKSILCSVPFLIVAAAAFFCHRTWIGILGMAGAVLFLIQHKMGYLLAKKDVTSEMYLVLPQWLMDMAILLQNNNVQVSIVRSREGAPAALQGELDRMLERMQKEPGKLQTYTDFCRDFDLPEIHSCMKMLHAVSEAGTGDVKIQMNHLLKRVNEMQDKADNIRNETAAFRMKMLFSYPVAAATGKLLVDLTTGMVLLFQMLGSMGGM